jgi:xylan 1,4-beta-xylosidase
VETLDKEHGDAITAWEAMGRPEPPNREQTVVLRKLAWSTEEQVVRTDGEGRLHLTIKLPPWSIVLIKQMD